MSTNFIPNGQTYLCNVSTTSSSVTVVATGGQPAGFWSITNAGTTDCFFRISTNPSVVASVPLTAGTSSPGQMINAGDSYIVGLPITDGTGPNSFVSNVTVAANCAGFGTSTQLFINSVLPLGK
jgi:hypothetical protein